MTCLIATRINLVRGGGRSGGRRVGHGERPVLETHEQPCEDEHDEYRDEDDAYNWWMSSGHKASMSLELEDYKWILARIDL
jgi:hypothetical protein